VPGPLAVFLAHRAFINCESLLRPAGVSPPFLAEGAGFVPPDFLLAAQRAFISSESFLRPAAVRAPFFLAEAGLFPLFSFAQRALAAADSLARVEGEKKRPLPCAGRFPVPGPALACPPPRIEERRLSRLSICWRSETASSKALTDMSMKNRFSGYRKAWRAKIPKRERQSSGHALAMV
jgi:hypothetical protein